MKCGTMNEEIYVRSCVPEKEKRKEDLSENNADEEKLSAKICVI
ncbi:MAG TPA: hypothetical protein PLB62_07025 [Candidatus Sumerlaeota bacterium]|nr:hypothetical protein [Candidatus Sumerlaeota bacterium]